MRIKRSLGERLFYPADIVIMIILVIFTLYPIWHVALGSISDPGKLMAHSGLVLRPYGFSLVSYKAVFKNPMIRTGYLNTIFILVAGVLLNMIMTCLGAYVLSRKKVLWNKAITFFIVFTMFFSGGLIPSFLNIKELGLYNSLWALIIPTAISTFNMIIMRTSFQTIPDSLEESAKLDGAGHFTILFRIVLPVSKAVIAVIILYYSVGHWNSWFDAMVYLQKRELYPLQLVLREILIQNQTTDMTMQSEAQDQEMIGETIKYAVIMVATVPILILYPFLQKYFVKGVMVGALKG
jgi:putative aldouronate transport system permease protein